MKKTISIIITFLMLLGMTSMVFALPIEPSASRQLSQMTDQQIAKLSDEELYQMAVQGVYVKSDSIEIRRAISKDFELINSNKDIGFESEFFVITRELPPSLIKNDDDPMLNENYYQKTLIGNIMLSSIVPGSLSESPSNRTMTVQLTNTFSRLKSSYDNNTYTRPDTIAGQVKSKITNVTIPNFTLKYSAGGTAVNSSGSSAGYISGHSSSTTYYSPYQKNTKNCNESYFYYLGTPATSARNEMSVPVHDLATNNYITTFTFTLDFR